MLTDQQLRDATGSQPGATGNSAQAKLRRTDCVHVSYLDSYLAGRSFY